MWFNIAFFDTLKFSFICLVKLKPEAYLEYGRQGTCHEPLAVDAIWLGIIDWFGSFGYQQFRIDTFLLILTYEYISVY
jgi:hypothetical protein